jgi:hypothetical protein
MLSPAAEAFRLFVLRNGEASLSAQFARYLPSPPANADAARAPRRAKAPARKPGAKSKSRPASAVPAATPKRLKGKRP